MKKVEKYYLFVFKLHKMVAVELAIARQTSQQFISIKKKM